MKHNDDNDALELMFDAARKSATRPDDAFLAKLTADADRLTLRPSVTVPQQQPSWSSHFWSHWIPASGLVAATAAGVWIGAVLPGSELSTVFLADSQTAPDISVFLPASDLSQFGSLEVFE